MFNARTLDIAFISGGFGGSAKEISVCYQQLR